MKEDVIESREREDRGEILSLDDDGRGSFTDSGFGEGNGGNDDNMVVKCRWTFLVERWYPLVG